MMILRFWAPRNVPLVSIGYMIAGELKGNDLRAILNRHIEGNMILNVSVFPHDKATAFRREFIEPTLDNGFPVPGKYKVKSKLLYGREVEYLVDVVPHSRKLEDEPETVMWWRRGMTKAEVCRDIINKLKGYEPRSDRRPIPRFVFPSASSEGKHSPGFEEFKKYEKRQMQFVTNIFDDTPRIPYKELMEIMSRNRTGNDKPEPYVYNPNQKPDWGLHLTLPQLMVYCRAFGIELSDTPSMEDCERASKELSEKLQSISKGMFDNLFEDCESIAKAYATKGFSKGVRNDERVVVIDELTEIKKG